ncbi:hypothetical protein GCM10022251_80680 [Phytohabitans flavus]|uniref:Uncharacterized protein n=1 Tax=Phytohabitans flavus TaxID=1076124 RepID=A0A6F8XY84_9ACTN|nr:hypothetical protein Pflav_052320 [Phytohabitans flavus]
MSAGTGSVPILQLPAVTVDPAWAGTADTPTMVAAIAAPATNRARVRFIQSPFGKGGEPMPTARLPRVPVVAMIPQYIGCSKAFESVPAIAAQREARFEGPRPNGPQMKHRGAPRAHDIPVGAPYVKPGGVGRP